MTTAARAVAEYWRLKNLIRRNPSGWDSPVNVQDWAPNAPGYSWAVASRVDHCGLSMNTLLHNIGLRVNVDFPNCAWTPSARAWTDNRPPDDFTGILAGDLLLFRDAGSAYTATHIGIAIEDWDGSGVLSGEFNTTADGMGREYWRTPGYLVAAGRPAYTTAPIVVVPEVLDGPIITRWKAIGGKTSVIGDLVGVGKPLVYGAVRQQAERGDILWSSGTGAWELYGAIGRKWWDGASKHVGMPVAAEEDGPLPGMRQQRFARGRILWHPAKGASILIGDIGRAYDQATPEQRQQLGAIVAGEDVARVAVFDGGTISWAPGRKATLHV